MATLAELRAALFPAAVPLGPEPAPDRLAMPLGWVRVLRARVPALDALEVGDIVLAPGSALAIVAATPADIEALAAACRDARAAALLVVGGSGEPAFERVAEGLAAALERDTGVAAFRLERAEAAELERSIVAFLVNARAELEHQAGLLEARLEQLALRSGELAVLVAEIASSLGRAVALEGPRGEVLAVHAPPDVPDAAAAVREYHARPAAAALRVPLPAPARQPAASSTGAATAGASPGRVAPGRVAPGRVAPAGEPPSHQAHGTAGRLVLLGERPATELERLAGERIRGLLALQLAREDAVRRARDAIRRGDSLPAAGPPWVVIVARQIPLDGGAAPPRDAREEIRRRLRLLLPARRLVLRGDADSLELRAVAAPEPDDPDGLAIAERVARLIGRPVALSRPFEAPSGRSPAEAEARATLEAVESLPGVRGSLAGGVAGGEAGHGRAQIARSDRLAAYRLLGALHNLPDGSRQARALLAPILAGRPAVVGDRLRTLRALLETAGPAEAAAALGVHRNTIAYRARRIEALTGWRLSDPDLRLPLAVAVRIVQEEQGTGD